MALVAAIGGLWTVWLLGAAAAPIYDGLPIGTPPYRYLDPPPGALPTPPPTSASELVDLASSPNGATLQTGEAIPQADAEVPTEMLVLPEGVKEVRVSLSPVPPPPTLPADGRIDGNVYRLAVATTDGRPLQLANGVGALFQIDLRGTGSAREPHVEQYTGQGWVRIPFIHPVSGIFQFNPTQPGEFALVLPPGHDVLGPGLLAAVVVAAALLVLAAVLGLVRAGRRRKG